MMQIQTFQMECLPILCLSVASLQRRACGPVVISSSEIPQIFLAPPTEERCHRSHPGSIPGIGWFEFKLMRGSILEQLNDVEGVHSNQNNDVAQLSQGLEFSYCTCTIHLRYSLQEVIPWQVEHSDDNGERPK